GFENQSLALANQLKQNNWEVKIAQVQSENLVIDKEFEVLCLKSIATKQLQKLNLQNFESIILLLSDEENLKIATFIYENIGTKVVIVRLNDRSYFEKFHSLGVLIIDPATAMVSLLDHFVRSPNAASLLLGMDADQDTLDIEIRNKDIHGIRLRDLRLPPDILVLSVKRKGQLLVSHGYTRLRLGDVITLVGSENSLQKLKFKFDT
ncbi:MAG: TrkA C-terminal domain-containing protein, partial [Lutibacter sp.]